MIEIEIDMDIMSTFVYIASGIIAIAITGVIFLIIGHYLVKGQIQRWQ